jgi:hypothetical protein
MWFVFVRWTHGHALCFTGTSTVKDCLRDGILSGLLVLDRGED